METIEEQSACPPQYEGCFDKKSYEARVTHNADYVVNTMNSMHN